ncbi:hypothetical protein I6H88_13635 [Elizabethkingia bruuniana]|uniref:HTH cro/C1-type domain-containing protein n=1 Tax=Elizabethkingia bruuniana TaxID=1756149 RepID=A0A7T7UWF1_9FLAO|nr:hypothetical protein [Elizabethkingia bruuniana]KGO08571.1 hypothetical protein KS04_18510 [Elizabethkingia miricola]QQN57485.1 hypothetical protein I6H88_13635 [Elizabethkingia bruuniana]
MNKKEKTITNNNIEVSQGVLTELLSYLKSNPSRLAKELGYKSNVKIQHIKSGRNGISSEVASDIVNKYPDVNYNWLLTGKGEMINNVDEAENTPTEFSSLPINKQLEILHKENKVLKREVDRMSLMMEVYFSTLMAHFDIDSPEEKNPEDAPKPKSKAN